MDLSSLKSRAGFRVEVLNMEFEKSREMIERFIYSCSHGIRSPLNSMNGIIMLMKQADPQSEQYREYKAMLMQLFDRMQRILTQFAEYKWAMEHVITFQRVDIRKVIHGVMERMRLLAGFESIQFRVNVNQKGELFTDKTRFALVLDRLMLNAIAFRDPAKETTVISVFVTASEFGCNVQIVDNGLGIPDAEHEKLFTLFHRASPLSHGIGMGLYFVKQLMLQLDGEISFRSRDGLGSTFSFWIPSANRHGKR